ncbi:MAG: DUF624 domain-containing protein [Actinomycetia bacterium]|nr:DUF624 domain-containing protein [Actinomycetes bacterium]
MAGRPSDLLSGAEVGGSAFARVTAFVLWFVVLDALIVLACVPGFVVSVFLDRATGNLPLLVLCLLPAGPAVASVLFAWHRRDVEGPDLAPGARFWRGYRLNLRDVLAWWVPYVLLMALMTFIALNLGAVGWPAEVAWVFAGLALLITLVAGHLLVVTALFSFRTRDAVRLAAFLAIRHWRVTLADACVLAALVLVTRWLGEWVVALVAALVVFWWLRLAAPVIANLMDEFVDAGDHPDGS